ncbi:polysaccharide pyruvyl transferase family protein [Amycolatopsis dendrobii]|uniref:Polysaccharide pyruvyl transferase family protein n=1 Tax=Amycolatopsis dendrobii TaxID=2760662 RepID=A0A7W3VTZ5_9PSEU|nr:polysaccharide pyruvyl transferase family protein [Amycolatopsis dendrobii]MBB1153158.1 polysaccharide pyruvyl transferase family protein [Amycolatopsis dendrobii]
MTVRVGVFGLLGSGNLGNDGSLEAVLGFLRAEHPYAKVSAFCGGADTIRARYGIPAVRLNWYSGEYRHASGLRSIVTKGLGKIIDVFRTAWWVRRQNVVIVPGMGVLEATLPLRPWGFPYALFLLSLCGRLGRTKVALVSVGADRIRVPATRFLVRAASQLATYRSFRDELSRSAMADMGVRVTDDRVYPDLAFALPTPAAVEDPRAVGVGVMAYYGGNDDRAHGEEIYRAYVDAMTEFVRYLVAQERPVRLFIGDRIDREVVDEIVATVDSPLLSAAVPGTLGELMRSMAEVGTVVATRYHNVLCALKVGRPTVAIGYAKKNDVLMAEMGLGEFCQEARAIDVPRLVEQFEELQRRAPELKAELAARNEACNQQLKDQFALLSRTLIPAEVS